VDVGGGVLIPKACNDRLFNTELNVEVIYALIEVLLAPNLPKTWVHDIGRIVREAAEMVRDGKMKPDMQQDYVNQAVRDYLETSKK
jgi:hypothetical protein